MADRLKIALTRNSAKELRFYTKCFTRRAIILTFNLEQFAALDLHKLAKADTEFVDRPWRLGNYCSIDMLEEWSTSAFRKQCKTINLLTLLELALLSSPARTDIAPRLPASAKPILWRGYEQTSPDIAESAPADLHLRMAVP
jgi:hypothetical protein